MRQLPVEVFSVAEVRALEQIHARAHNGHCYDLMEKAGSAVFRELSNHCPSGGSAWIFCGGGNNGGDGYVTAACLKKRGAAHRVFAVDRPREGTEAQIACEYYLSLGGEIEFSLPGEDAPRPAVVVDALLGSGLKSAPRGRAGEWIAFINTLDSFKIAVDIPSGASADTGAVPGNCVSADLTVCMLALKPGLLTGDAVDYTGELVFEDLGVDAALLKSRLPSEAVSPLPAARLGYDELAGELPRRMPSCNKGDNGRVLLIAGSAGMGGAALMAGIGALRAGAGLVKIATETVNIPAINAARPELMTVNLRDAEALRAALRWADVIAAGPGLGRSAESRAALRELDSARQTVVLDADALNLLAAGEKLTLERLIMTPHPGEAGRLLGVSAAEVNADRLRAARELQRRYGGVVLLKGAGTVICDGRSLTVITEGSPALATGGMGDLLTGMIASLRAQGLSLKLAAACAAAVHGRAGRLCGQRAGIIGTLPLDLAPVIRSLMNGRDQADA